MTREQLTAVRSRHEDRMQGRADFDMANLLQHVDVLEQERNGLLDEVLQILRNHAAFLASGATDWALTEVFKAIEALKKNEGALSDA